MKKPKPEEEARYRVNISKDENLCYACPCGACFEPAGRVYCPFCEGDPYDDGELKKIDYTKLGKHIE